MSEYNDLVGFQRCYWCGEPVWRVIERGTRRTIGYVWSDKLHRVWCWLKPGGGASEYVYRNRSDATLGLLDAVTAP